jgi:hypothetical protein
VIVVTLLVRDEVDIVAATIEHHIDAGAAVVIVTDNGSIDGTVDVLQAYKRAGVVHLIHEPQQDYSQAAWVTRMARLATSDYKADWVINAAADEFWQPKNPGIALQAVFDSVDPEVGTIVAHRVNLVGSTRITCPWPQRLVYRDLLSVSERGTPLGAKVCHRGSVDVSVAQGNHAATGTGIGSALEEEPLEILHVPMRSYEQFAHKIKNGGSSYARNVTLEPGTGWHWRADYQRLLAGTLRETYDARQPTEEDLVCTNSNSRYTADSGLCNHLQGLLKRAVLPDELNRVLEENRKS